MGQAGADMTGSGLLRPCLLKDPVYQFSIVLVSLRIGQCFTDLFIVDEFLRSKGFGVVG